jgi:surface antigen
MIGTTAARASTSLEKKHHASHPSHEVRVSAGSSSLKHSLSKSGKARYARGGGGISCVPFARAASGISLKGNAANWWDAAAGVYERGSQPEAGSVLNFRATGSMRLGHVAVVTNVVGEREIEIDHANWSGPGASKGGVSRGIRVEDVSANNDWSAVRVALGHSGDYGSVYPTYGFIYDRPDDGSMVAKAGPRPGSDRAMLNEVAEAPPAAMPVSTLPMDAPDRSLR